MASAIEEVHQGQRREWMGVEPTMASSSLPINGFEDRGGHRVSTTPTCCYDSHFDVGRQGQHGVRDGHGQGTLGQCCIQSVSQLRAGERAGVVVQRASGRLVIVRPVASRAA